MIDELKSILGEKTAHAILPALWRSGPRNRRLEDRVIFSSEEKVAEAIVEALWRTEPRSSILVWIPNRERIGYCQSVAEFTLHSLQGSFRRRDLRLLDQTSIRFISTDIVDAVRGCAIDVLVVVRP